MRRVVLTVLILMLCGTLAFAQIFPEEETLDVVRITDGSVLRGRIIEDFVDRSVTIEIYGGSVFTIAYENIEALEEEANPDYGTQWIRIEVGDPSVLAGGAGDDSGRPEYGYLGKGHIFGIGVGAANTDFYGSDWEDALDAVNADGVYGNVWPSVALSYTFMVQARPDVAPWWMWGLRAGLSYTPFVAHYDILDPQQGENYGEYKFAADVLEVPAEFLIGGGGDRLNGYVGIGIGGSFLLGEPSSEFEGNEIGHPGGGTVDNPVQAIVLVSAGGYFRVSERWTGDLRYGYTFTIGDGWYSDFTQYYSTHAVRIGIGYQIR